MGAGGQNFVRRQREAVEARIALIVPDPEMYLAAFQQFGLLATEGFRELYLHIGIAQRVSRQECRKDAFDRVRRRGELQDAAVATP